MEQVVNITKTVQDYIACVSTNKKMLIFKSTELPNLSKGGGVVLQKTKIDYFLSDIQTFMLKDGILWKIGSQERNLKDLSYWIGKRAQTGKKTPSRFNKDLKFLNEIK